MSTRNSSGMSASSNILPPKNPPTSFPKMFTVVEEGSTRFFYYKGRLTHSGPLILSKLVRQKIGEKSWQEFLRSEDRFRALKGKKELLEQFEERKIFPTLAKLSRRKVLSRIAYRTKMDELRKMYEDCTSKRSKALSKYPSQQKLFHFFKM